MHIVIFTGGTFHFGEKIKKIVDNADMIIAADSGAETAIKHNYIPKIILGDFDSLEEKTKQVLENKGSVCIILPAEKDETDTELAIDYAIKQNATDITVLGGIEGDRIDHILGNIFLTTDLSVPVKFMNGKTTAWIEKGPKQLTIAGEPNDILSLIPLTSQVTEVETKFLHYPLHKETLLFGKPRGISNVFLEKNGEVKFHEGILLFVRIDK